MGRRRRQGNGVSRDLFAPTVSRHSLRRTCRRHGDSRCGEPDLRNAALYVDLSTSGAVQSPETRVGSRAADGATVVVEYFLRSTATFRRCLVMMADGASSLPTCGRGVPEGDGPTGASQGEMTRARVRREGQSVEHDVLWEVWRKLRVVRRSAA